MGRAASRPAGPQRHRHHGSVGALLSGRDPVEFRQTTSRADDPQLHTHLVNSSKVQTADGRWLALDARMLKRYQCTLGDFYLVADDETAVCRRSWIRSGGEARRAQGRSPEASQEEAGPHGVCRAKTNKRPRSVVGILRAS